MDGVGLAQFVASDLGQAEVTDLAVFDELGHRADGVSQWDGWVAAVHVVQVDDLDAHPGQAGVDSTANVGGVVADRHRSIVGTDVAELGGKGDVVSVVADER